MAVFYDDREDEVIAIDDIVTSMRRVIQHDCGHGSFFRHRLTNDRAGRAISVLTLTPYDFCHRAHGVRHATSGNLDQGRNAPSTRRVRFGGSDLD
jgi:fatty acid desaturase